MSLLNPLEARRPALSPIFAGLLIAAAVPGVAAAQSVDFTVGVASENVGKGLGKSGGEPSVSGEVGVGQGDFYASLSASTVDIAQGADTETVATVGYAPEIGAWKFDVSAMHKTLSGAPAGYDDRFMEYQADVSRAVGPVGLRMRVNYSPDSSGGTEEAWWVELQGGMALGARSRATVALGERTQNGERAYVAWNAGVKHKLTDKLALDVRWYDTDSHERGERYDGRLVGALSVTF